MRDEMKNFLDEVEKSEELKVKLTALKDKKPDEILSETISIALENGYTLEQSDFEEEVEIDSVELDPDELAAVSGGGDCLCVCSGAGGGKAGGKYEGGCGCAAVGYGGFYIKGEHTTKGTSNDGRCYCFLGGYGQEWI